MTKKEGNGGGLVCKAASSPCRLFAAPKKETVVLEQEPSILDTSPLLETLKCAQSIPMESWHVPRKVMEKFSYPVIEKTSLMFPEFAMLLARKNTNQYDAIRAMNCMFTKCYGLSRAGWMKLKKPKPKEKIDHFKEEIDASIKALADKGIVRDYDKFSKISGILCDEKIIVGYAEFNKYDIESVKLAIKTYPNEMLDELREYRDIINSATSASDERAVNLPEEY